jgi:hypothetical protein
MHNQSSQMFVIKRNGEKEKVMFDKITLRIDKLINEDEQQYIDPTIIAMKVINSIYSGISTEELDLESAKICSNMVTTNPIYGKLAGRILVSNLHKKTLNNFVDKMVNVQVDCSLLDEDWLLLCHRIIIANQFNFSKAELLLCEAAKLQHEHCVVVDIRHELPKILPRLIQIDTTQQRRSLLAAGKVFASIESDQEGNLRQRRYRFDRLAEWLKTTFSQDQIVA